MERTHHIIYVPGLNDQHFFNRNVAKLLPLFWDSRQFPITIVPPLWRNTETFQKKLLRITDKIDQLVQEKKRVSIIGQSAGGSAALNAFTIRKNVLIAAINATGRLREGQNVSPSLALAAKYGPAFAESVTLFEKESEKTLTQDDRKRILTIRPAWDEIVPASTVPIEGATNLVAPMYEHVFGGVFIMSLYSKVLRNFLTSFD